MSVLEQIWDPNVFKGYRLAVDHFLKISYRFGIDPAAPVCRFFVAGLCPNGNECDDRHVVASSDRRVGSIVCKHWLRGLCKKGEGCEFLHEYNLKRMPECKIATHFPTAPDDCVYQHPDPEAKAGFCGWYEMGFCPLGQRCKQKHVKGRVICENWLAGFCPDGLDCIDHHPKHKTPLHPPIPKDLVPHV